MMPISMEPPLEDDEIECGNCGARFYIGLSRCPSCGINLYEPDEEAVAVRPRRSRQAQPHPKGLFARLDDLIRRLTRRPYAVDELFVAAVDQAELFDDLLLKVGGDRPTAERLIEFESRRLPQSSRITWIKNAIWRWEQDNRQPPRR